MTDFIIVGRGLAANVMAHVLYSRQMSFTLIGNEQLSNCSRVAAGIWNPVVFKRLTRSWMAKDLVVSLLSFYTTCEKRLEKKLITRRPIVKPFVEDHEKTLWRKKAHAELEDFLDPVIHSNIPPALRQCRIPNGYGTVLQAGSLDVPLFLKTSAGYFGNCVVDQTFDHTLMKVTPGEVVYKQYTARHIVFCEGHLVSGNPFFKWIPLKPAKGEVLTVEAPDLEMRDMIFNKNGFLMDRGNSTFTVGSTYQWDELSDKPTADGAAELTAKLSEMTPCGFRVLKHEAGIRPSSIDRRPIIGAHPTYKNMWVFNGLGTKGVMLAPFFAEKLVNCCTQGDPLNDDVNVNRFYHLYGRQA